MILIIWLVLICGIFASESTPNNPFPQKYYLIFIIAGIWVFVSSCSGCCITCKTKFTGKCNKIIMSIYIIISLVGASLHMVCTSCLMVLIGMIEPGIYRDLYDWLVALSLRGESYSQCCEDDEFCASHYNCDSEESYNKSKVKEKMISLEAFYLRYIIYGLIALFVIQVYFFTFRY